MVLTKATLSQSPRAGKKLRATFTTDDGKSRHIDFGAEGSMDFTKYSKESPAVAKQKKSNYLKRHAANENWSKYDTAGALSRFVLWNLPTVEASWRDYKQRFNLK